MVVLLAEEVVLHPDDRAVGQSQLTTFRQWCEARTGQNLPDHAAMDRFSVKEFRSFWRLFLEWCELPRNGAVEPVCVGDVCETARFFPDLRLNYAECLLAGAPDQPVLTACHAGGSRDRFTRGALRVAVARLATSLQQLGVRRGDHVVAIARNNAEAVIAALATAALGATFASCAPDMGVPAILARFAPLEPVVLLGCLRAEPWDLGVPVAERVAGAAAGLPGLAAIISLDNGSLPAGERTVPLHRLADLLRDAVGGEDRPGWLRHPFNQPLFTMFSSGTTGPPKCIQHGAGGTLLEHVKEHRLHCDFAPGDKLFFQTSCGWMMWNWQLSALASGVELVLYDGPLEVPETFWRIVAEERVTVFGTNPAYLDFCEKAGLSPGRVFDPSALRAMLSTGSILYPRQYDWVRDEVKAAMPLQSISGGTDIIGCFVLGNPDLPVHRGEAQCRSFGLDVRSLPPPDDPEGRIGELVCANPFPSRPLGFHGDTDGTRFHAAYFAQNPGFWTHGDLIEATPHGGWRLHGRSDEVLNVRGIRIGTAEIYRILADIEEIREAMAVEQKTEEEASGSRMVLLVVLREGLALDNMLAKHIRSELARCGSPAFVPARIAQVDALPVTFSGKRSEAAARDAVNSRPVRNRDALQNPECLETIAKHPAVLAPAAVRVSRAPAPDRRAIPDGDRLRQELQAICEHVLGVSPIGWSDNLLGLGAHSLAVVNLLLEIEGYAGRPMPLLAFLSAPSVEGLATVLSIGAEAMAAQQTGWGPDDQEPACRFLEEAFPRVKAATWRNNVNRHLMSPLLTRARRFYRNRHVGRFRRELAAGHPLKLEEVEAVLDQLRVGSGDRLSIHSHSVVLAQIQGGIPALLEHLKERVTPRGMLWMTTSPFCGSMSEYAATDPIFDVRRTPSQMGLINEVFRRSRGTTRSVHPTHPVALWGSDAEEWAAGHEEDPVPFHLKGPYGRLYRNGGKVLFMELDGSHLTEIHIVEGILRDQFPVKAYLERPADMRVVDWRGQQRRVSVFLHNPVFGAQIDPRHCYPEMERLGIVKRVYLRGYIPFVLVDVTPMVDYFLARVSHGRDYYHWTSGIGYLRGFLERLEGNAPPAAAPPANST